MRGTRISQEDEVDFNNLFQLVSTPGGIGLVVLIVHALLGWGIGKAVKYFYGWNARVEFNFWWYLPYSIFWRVLKRVGRWLTSPWRHREARLFKSEFGFDLPTEDKEIESTQFRVNNHLKELAKMLDAACRDEEELLQQGNVDSEARDQAKHRVKYNKRHFWDAHELADQVGYGVRLSYSNYL